MHGGSSLEVDTYDTGTSASTLYPYYSQSSVRGAAPSKVLEGSRAMDKEVIL